MTIEPRGFGAEDGYMVILTDDKNYRLQLDIYALDKSFATFDLMRAKDSLGIEPVWGSVREGLKCSKQRWERWYLGQEKLPPLSRLKVEADFR